MKAFACVALISLLVGCVSTGEKAPPSGAPPQSGAERGVLNLTDRGARATEPSIATRGDVVVVADYAWSDNASTNRYNLSLHRSLDAGASWRLETLPASVLEGRVPPRTSWSVADPELAFAPNGDLYLAGIALLAVLVDGPGGMLAGQMSASSVFVTKSTDDGATWSPALFYQQGAGTFGFPVFFAGAFEDKDALVVAPEGSVHLAWAHYAGTPGQIDYARSTDGGQTWSAPRAVAQAAPGRGVHGPSLAATRGRVLLGYMDFALGSLDGEERVVESRDAGGSFGAPRVAGHAGPGRFAQVVARGDGACVVGTDASSRLEASCERGGPFHRVDVATPASYLVAEPAGAILDSGDLLVAAYLDRPGDATSGRVFLGCGGASRSVEAPGSPGADRGDYLSVAPDGGAAAGVARQGSGTSVRVVLSSGGLVPACGAG